jgi:hypothetical protein
MKPIALKQSTVAIRKMTCKNCGKKMKYVLEKENCIVMVEYVECLSCKHFY